MTGSLFDLLTLVGAIAFLVLILQWRALLAMPLRVQRARPSPVDLARALAMDDLMPAIEAELSALGFEGPHWYTLEQEPVQLRGMAAFSHADGTQLFLLPLYVLENPNRCITYLISELRDGRRAISQVADPYFELTRVDGELAQTLPPGSLSEAVSAHRQWVATHGNSVFVDASERLNLVGDWLSKRRQAMLAAGMAETAADGITRFKLGFSWKALRAFWTRARWPADKQAVPINRLTLIAQHAQRSRHNMPSAGNQWLIFALSVLLFVGLGWYFFGLTFALVLMLVIGVHELGHYLAMLAFGYRNVHMLALPLVGGVTIGQEAHPNALHRAWMSLMGPLPGLLIGWGLLIWLAVQDPSQLFKLNEPLALAMLTFILVNYLNMLPFLPLDGGHIVQAMLPPRWYLVRIGFVLLGAGLGIAFGLATGLVGIAILAALQLLTIAPQWQTRKAVLHLLARGETLRDLNAARKLRLALEALEHVAGPPAHLNARIGQAEDVVRTLDVRSMSWFGGLLTAGTYGSLLLSPLVVLLAVGLYAGVAHSLMAGYTFGLSELEQQVNQRVAKEDQRLRAEASDMTMAQLLNALSIGEPEPIPGPASGDAIAAAEERLGTTLPEALQSFYALNNGHPALGLLPIEEVVRVKDHPEDLMQLDRPCTGAGSDPESSAEGPVASPSEGTDCGPVDSINIDTTDDAGDYSDHTISRDKVRDWLYLGGFQSDDLILFDLAETPAIQNRRLINYFFEDSTAYPGLLAFLREQYQQRQISDYYDTARQAVFAQRLQTLQPRSDIELLNNLPEPSLLDLAEQAANNLEASVDESAWKQFAETHDVTVPASLRTIYEAHNGRPVQGFAPLSAIRPLPADYLQDEMIQTRLQAPFQLGTEDSAERRLNLSVEDFANCLHLSPPRPDPDSEDLEALVYRPHDLVWCPKPRHPDVEVIDLASSQVFNSWRAYLLHLAAAEATLEPAAASAP